MPLSKAIWPRKGGGGRCAPLFVLFVIVVSAHGQNFEITPLVGATFGGTLHLEQTGTPNYYAHVADAFSFGLAGGYRLDADDGGHDLVEFRWLRQDSHLTLPQNPLAVSGPVPTPYTSSYFRPSVTLDRFLADFSHEFPIQEAPSIEPFVTASLGAALMSLPASSATRFAFGLGAGVKIFPALHWGFRLEAEYQPIVMHAELQRLVCTTGCIVVLNGGIMNQFQLSL